MTFEYDSELIDRLPKATEYRVTIPAGTKSATGGTLAETVSANKTLALADCGVLQLVDTDSITVTLPATVVGYSYTIMNYAADGAAIVKIAPNASDLIAGGNATATDADTWNNTKATAKRGDFISIVGDGVNGWMITEMKGIWAVIAI